MPPASLLTGPRGLRVVVALGATALAMLLLGCSSTVDVTTSPDATATTVSVLDTPSPSPTTSPVSAAATPPATALPVKSPTPDSPSAEFSGGFLRFSIPEAGPHFDIHREVSPAMSTWGIGLIYSRLFRMAPVDSELLVECELCEGWEFAAADRLRVKLRPDVNWQDIEPLNGRRLVASDIVFSLERQRAPGNPNGDLLVGVGEITAPDDSTLELELVTGGLNADLLLDLADGRTRIVAPEAVAVNGDLLRGPNVGSGPWIWINTTSQTAAYDRNPNYFERNAPLIDGLQISYIPDASTRLAAYRTGLLDFVDSTDSDDIAEAMKRVPESSMKVVPGPGFGAEIALNTRKAPFDSAHFRRAVFRAMDPWRDLEDVWGGDGTVTLGIPAPRESWLLSEDAMRSAFADLERAEELAARSGVVPGGSIEITVGQFGEPYLLQAQRVAESLALLGFDSTIREVTTRDFADDVWIGGGYDVFVGAQAPVDGVSDDLFSVHHSDGLWNTTGFGTEELDGLIELQASQTEPSERKRTLIDAQFRILEGAHRFTVASRDTYWLAREWVGGFDPDPRRGENFWLSRLTLGEQEVI